MILGMQRQRFLAGILLVVLGGAAGAQELNCANPQAQQEMNICARQGYEVADAKLNAVYRDAMEFARRAGIAEQLRTAQRAWIPYRDAACETEAGLFEGGTMQPFLRDTCLTRLTDIRTADLRVLSDSF